MILTLLSLGSCATPTSAPELGAMVDLESYVDPRIATGGLGYGVGCGVPGATRPLGMVKASPDTADKNGSDQRAYRGGGYHADDVYVQGFSAMHMYAIGSTDYGNVSLMPSDGMDTAHTTEEGYRLHFSHDNEVARAGYYSVTFDDPPIQAQLSATDHTALHHYSFPDSVAEPTVLLDACHVLGSGVCLAADLQLDPQAGTITGSVFNAGEMAEPFELWFEIVFDQPPAAWGTWTDGALDEGATTASSTAPDDETSASAGAWLRFSSQEVGARVAVSTVDADGAHANLLAEHDGFDIEEAEAQAEADWVDALSPVHVWGGTEDQRTIFATALYHQLMMPTLWSDADGRYHGFDGDIHDAGEHTYHTDFSLWDTYRTTHPLYTLIWPQRHIDLLWSLSRMAEQGGGVPRWPAANWDAGSMVGEPGSIVVSEAIQKGLEGWDPEPWLEVASQVATGTLSPPYGGRPDVSLLDTYGYYPSDLVGSSVSNQLELATADFALAQVVDDPALIELLDQRAGGWDALYDTDVGYFHGRLSDGSWADFNSDSAWLEEYSEGDARQYLWLVIHDPEGLAEVLGGQDAAVARLSDFFQHTVDEWDETLPGFPRPWYWHGNEVDLHAAWLFALWGRPDLTRHWVHWIMGQMYGTGPDGLAGNDDGGTLSAWYVWAAIGMYPLAGTDRYVLGDPVFPLVEIDRPEGTLTIERLGEAPVVQVRLDDEVLDTPDLHHSALVGSHTLSFVGADAM